MSVISIVVSGAFLFYHPQFFGIKVLKLASCSWRPTNSCCVDTELDSQSGFSSQEEEDPAELGGSAQHQLQRNLFQVVQAVQARWPEPTAPFLPLLFIPTFTVVYDGLLAAPSASVVQDYTAFWTQLKSDPLRLDSTGNSVAGVSDLQAASDWLGASCMYVCAHKHIRV